MNHMFKEKFGNREHFLKAGFIAIKNILNYLRLRHLHFILNFAIIATRHKYWLDAGQTQIKCFTK